MLFYITRQPHTLYFPVDLIHTSPPFRWLIVFFYNSLLGTLAPPLLKQTDPDYSRSMDVLFATYWFYPAKTKILLEEDNKCIEDMMKQEVQRLDPQSKEI